MNSSNAHSGSFTSTMTPVGRRRSLLDGDPFDPFADPISRKKTEAKRRKTETGKSSQSHLRRQRQKHQTIPDDPERSAPKLTVENRPPTTDYDPGEGTSKGPILAVSRCCLCQMPLRLLGPKESPLNHQSCCLEISFEEMAPCPLRGHCQAREPRHYRLFSHFDLAAKHDGKDRHREREASDDDCDTENRLAEDNWGCLGNTLLADNKGTPQGAESIGTVNSRSGDGGKEPGNEVRGQAELEDTDTNNNSGVQAEADGSDNGKDIPVVQDPKSPLKVTAEIDSQKLNICLEVVDPGVNLERFDMQIAANDMRRPIACKGVVRQKDNFMSREEASKAWKDIFNKKKASSSPSGSGDASKEVSKGNNLSHPTVRKCPFYKRIPNTPFVVDAFSYGSKIPGVTKYFLSHFHYDHYHGLSKHFSNTLICSKITSRLVQLKIRVHPSKIRELPLGEPVVIDQVEVTLLEANHCPGAVMFLFKLTSGQTYLHCGDFRAIPQMEEYPELWNCSVDKVYLDTTYCKPEYDFPSQTEVIQSCVAAVDQLLKKKPKTLILVGSYTIGKERVFLALAEKLDCKIWASTEKSKVLKALGDPIVRQRLTSDARSARIHVVEMSKTQNRRELLQYAELLGPGAYDHVLAISPTGWKHSRGSTSEESLSAMAIRSYGSVSSFDVPYSEHSSFSELRRFVKFLKLRSADCVIPTVNVGKAEDRAAMRELFNVWINDERKKSKHVSNFKV